MKKKVLFGLVLVFGFCFSGPVSAISEGQREAIVNNCSAIHDNLRNVQKMDARTRVFLGSHFETVLTKFILPLNMRLVENNLSDAGLIENQNNFATMKAKFATDFIVYQQELEGLVAMDCRAEPEKFYEKLEATREKRKTVMRDVGDLRALVVKQVKLVEKFKEGV